MLSIAKDQYNEINQHSNNAGITEVVLPSHDDNTSMALVLPMLAHLSHQSADKWLTWIAPKNISKATLDKYGFAKYNVRLVHTHDDEESLWVFWDALANGNSHTVVGALDSLSDEDRQRLENASMNNATRGLVLSARRH